MNNMRSPRVLWLTNLPAPYRFPIWTRMAEFTDLTVAFLLGEDNWRNWIVPIGQTWKHQFLSLRSFNIREYDLILSIRGANKLLKNIDVLILGGWETPIYIYSMLLARMRKIPVIQFYESTGKSQRFKNILIRQIRSKVISRADFVITIGLESSNAVEAMGVATEKIITLFNPVDVDWFHSFSRKNRTITPIGHHYLYAGQLIQRKNVSLILKSFAAVRRNGDTLTIAGDGPLAQNLMSLSLTLDLGKSVNFVGHLSQEDLAKLYATSNTLVLASTNEVWGLVVNEALASGMHVVVSKNCGVSEFIQDMKGCYTFATNQESLEMALQRSSYDWNGHIQWPEILQFTPQKFADKVTALCESFQNF